jgi:hypothetical protein
MVSGTTETINTNATGTNKTINSNAASTSGSLKTPKLSNNSIMKRLLSVSATASLQKKKKFNPFSIMSQMNGSLQELGSVNKVNERMHELEQMYKAEKLKLKGREIAVLKKKTETEINLLKI